MQSPQADAVPACIATPMGDVNSIEPWSLRTKAARSDSSGVMDAVARISETIRSFQHGPMLRRPTRSVPGAGIRAYRHLGIRKSAGA